MSEKHYACVDGYLLLYADKYMKKSGTQGITDGSEALNACWRISLIPDTGGYQN